MGDLHDASAAREVSRALDVLVSAGRWVHAVLRAESDASRFFNAAKAQAQILLSEMRAAPLTPYLAMRSALVVWLETVSRVNDVTAIEQAALDLAQIQLPVFYFSWVDPYADIKRVRDELRQPRRSGGDVTNPEAADLTVRVVKLLFSVDGAPWATPQAVRSMVQYDVEARAEVGEWPTGMEVVEVDFLSTQDPQTYLAPQYRWTRGEVESGTVKRGCILFRVAQSLHSKPISLATRARFLASEGLRMFQATVIGHADLQVRALDQSSYPVLTRYPMIDIQIPKVLEEVRQALPDLRPADFDDFMSCLVILGRYAGMVQQTGVFKGKNVDEKRDFQQHLLQHLRMHLGADVHEEETLAGGRLDLRFRNVVIELKVECHVKDRTKLKTKFVRQPAQYSASGIPVSVVCILDMVEKTQPPSNVANNITLETPSLHGHETVAPMYPSKVAVVIIDGNLKSPSAYS